MSGAICNGGVAFEARAIQWCPVENRRRRFYGRFQHWYGWEWYCLGCGDRWSGDGEMGSRPFERGWRGKAIARAKERWADVSIPARNRRRAFRAFMEAFLADELSA
jgi:hypothetical protein